MMMRTDVINKELDENMGMAVLHGCKCLVVSDEDYQELQVEVTSREHWLGVIKDGKPRYMLYRGVHVFPASKVVNLSH